jgi:hypothetical protein
LGGFGALGIFGVALNPLGVRIDAKACAAACADAARVWVWFVSAVTLAVSELMEELILDVLKSIDQIF